jgi:hypothetical protein
VRQLFLLPPLHVKHVESQLLQNGLFGFVLSIKYPGLQLDVQVPIKLIGSTCRALEAFEGQVKQLDDEIEHVAQFVLHATHVFKELSLYNPGLHSETHIFELVPEKEKPEEHLEQETLSKHSSHPFIHLLQVFPSDDL